MLFRFNDYVLTTCVQHGWITSEQRTSAENLLQSNPTLAAVDLLSEQQIIGEEISEWLRTTIEQHVAAAETPAKHQTEVSVSLHHGFTHIHDFLHKSIEMGASDLHIGPDAPPLLRKNGHLAPMLPDFPTQSASATEYLARQLLNPLQQHDVEEHGSVEFCYDFAEVSRFRTSVVRQRRGWEMVFRTIKSEVPSIDALGLPPIFKTLTGYHNGLILVTGPIGSGKSTTLAAMVDYINQQRHDHIITLEDPIEYVFKSANCQVSQREVHSHTKSFSTALRAALREDPDVIMVGEMRDLETISLAITASETGHLVLGTLHTSTAARTLDRLLDVFPITQQAQIRTMVSDSIRGIICQQLVPRMDGQGRALALEIMLNSPAVGALIRDAKTFMLPGIIQTGRKQGMALLDDSLMTLFGEGTISAEEAYFRCDNKKLFAQELARRHK